MVATTDIPPESPLSPDDLSLLAHILLPCVDSLTLNPLNLARLLKNPAVIEALKAHETISTFRLQQQITAATAKAVARLSAILDVTEDPIEIRRVSGILARLQSQKVACSSLLRLEHVPPDRPPNPPPSRTPQPPPTPPEHGTSDTPSPSDTTSCGTAPTVRPDIHVEQQARNPSCDQPQVPTPGPAQMPAHQSSRSQAVPSSANPNTS